MVSLTERHILTGPSIVRVRCKYRDTCSFNFSTVSDVDSTSRNGLRRRVGFCDGSAHVATHAFYASTLIINALPGRLNYFMSETSTCF